MQRINIPGRTGLLAARESALGTVDWSATAAPSRESYRRVLLRVRVCTRQQDMTISTYASGVRSEEELVDIAMSSLRVSAIQMIASLEYHCKAKMKYTRVAVERRKEMK